MSASGAQSMLREAVARADWESAEAALRSRLAELDPPRAVEIAREELCLRRQVFEAEQPGVRWPGRLLDDPSDALPTFDELVELAGAGSSNFADAVESLALAVRAASEDDMIDLIHNALLGAVMAGLAQRWGRQHRADWDRWFQAAKAADDDPATWEVLQEMMADPGVIAARAAAWEALATRLAG